MKTVVSGTWRGRGAATLKREQSPTNSREEPAASTRHPGSLVQLPAPLALPDKCSAGAQGRRGRAAQGLALQTRAARRRRGARVLLRQLQGGEQRRCWRPATPSGTATLYGGATDTGRPLLARMHRCQGCVAPTARSSSRTETRAARGDNRVTQACRPERHSPCSPARRAHGEARSA